MYFVYPEMAGKTLEELGEVFGDKSVGGGAARGGGDMDDVAVVEKSPKVPLEGIKHNEEDMHRREESDEDDMVDVDVNSVDEEVEGRRRLDGDIHRALLEVLSEVTLPVAENEKEGCQEP